MDKLLLRTFLYLGDGLLWIYSSYFLLSGFFGYRIKPQKHRLLTGVTAAVVYDIINVGIYIYARSKGENAGLIVEFLTLALLVYWCIYTEEKNNLKVILTLVTSYQMVITMMSVVSVIMSTFLQMDYVGLESRVSIYLLAPFLEIGFIYLMSRFSSRKRKEPMSSALIFVTFLMFLAVDGILGFFSPDDNSAQLQPMSRIQLLIADIGAADQYVAMGILGFVIALLVVFIIMIVKESEAGFFRRKNAISEYYLEAQKDHYESLMQSNREIRKIKHDMKNHMFCLKELSDKGDYKALDTYIAQLSENLEATQRMVFTKNEIVDAIIEEKTQKAKQKNITVNVEGDMVGVDIAALDLCTIFSNLIDNAMEAVEKLPEDNRRITLEIKKNKNFLIITEQNPIAQPILIQENRIATSKHEKENHGFGIMNIEEAVAKYDGECHLYTEDENTFVFEIAFPL